MNEGIELFVYRHTDLSKSAGVLSGRRQPKYLDELGIGAGSFLISVSDPMIIEDPTLIDYRNVIKVSDNGKVIGAFRIDHKVTKLLESSGHKDEVYEVSGEGVLSLFNDAQVRPFGGLKTYSQDDRYFNFAAVSIIGSGWYKAADWPLAVSLGKVYELDQWWKDSPAKEQWPEAAHSKAHWIWSEAVGPDNDVPTGLTYFRHDFDATEAMDLVIYAIGDDNLELFFDGQKLGDYNWRTASHSRRDPVKMEFKASQGRHVLAATVENLPPNGYDNPAGLVAAIFKINADGSETLWHYTGNNANDATTWRANGYPPTPPVWSPGEILLTLMAEAGDRGVRFVQWLNPTFTNTLDSNGDPWPDELKFEWSFSVGEKLSSVITKFREVGIDVRIDPDTFDLHMSPPRGENRTLDPNSVTFEIGKNLRRAQSDGRGKVTNNLAVRTSEGWVIADDQASTEEYGVVEDVVEADVTARIAEALAGTVFSRRSSPEESATYDISASHEKPWIDFQAGDWVLAPNEKGLRVPRQVVSISIEENSGGISQYNVEFDTIWQSNEQRLNNAINKTGGAGIGGSFANAGGNVPSIGKPVVTTPPSTYIDIPRAPMSLTVTSEGFWEVTGVNTYSRFTIEWGPVTLSTGGVEIVPMGYEVWATNTSLPNEIWELVGFVTTNSATLQPFVPGEVYELKVRTITSTAVSAYSEIVSHLALGPIEPMAAPSTPTLGSARGVLSIKWDGKLGANNPPPQFRNVYAEVFEVGSAVPYAKMGMALTRGGGSIPISGLTIGETYRVRLTAVDGVGIESPKSETAEIVLTGVDLGDLEAEVQDAIDAAAAVATALQVEFDDFYATDFINLDTAFNDFYDNDLPELQASSASVGRLLVADQTNLADGLNFEDLTLVPSELGIPNSSFPYYTSGNARGARSLRVDPVASPTYTGYVTRRVVPGATYRVTMWVFMYSGWDGTASQSKLRFVDMTAGSAFLSALAYREGPDHPVNTWVERSMELVIPDDCTEIAYALGTDSTANYVLVDDISIRRMNGGELLVDGTVATRHMQANSVYAQHVVIGSMQNEVPNGMGEAEEAVAWAKDLTWDTTQKPDGMRGSFKSAKSQGTLPADLNDPSNQWDVDPGSEHLMEIWLYADVPDSHFYLELRDEHDNHGTINTIPLGYTDGVDSWAAGAYPVANAKLPGGEWRRYVSLVTVNATTTKLRLGSIYFNHPNGAPVQNAQVWMLTRMRPRTGPELMVDGSILTRHLGAQVVDTPQLRADAVTADIVKARELRGFHLGFHSITGDEMELGTLTVNHVNPSFGEDLVIEGNSQIILALSKAAEAEGAANTVGGTVEEMRTYYKFGAEGAEIVNPDSPYSLWLSNDSIAIMQGGTDGTKVSEWTSGQLRVNEFVGTTASLGNHQLSQYSGGTVMRSLV